MGEKKKGKEKRKKGGPNLEGQSSLGKGKLIKGKKVGNVESPEFSNSQKPKFAPQKGGFVGSAH